jgi:fibronectin-binding autotransporter adhesin
LRAIGSLSGITTLTNTGTVSLQGNGTTQILSVADADFRAGSFFDIDVDTTGGNDKLIADTATLNGTVRVNAGTADGPYNPNTIYTILSANTVTGEFDGVTTDLAFLDPRLRYDANSVQLALDRNDVSFAEAGRTDNQRAAAAGVESLGAGNDIYESMLWLNEQQAGKAFDSLSGEGYASFESVSIQSAAVIADLLTARLDRTFDALDEDRPILVSAYAEEPALASALQSGAARHGGGWVAAYGATANLPGDGNTADVDSTMGGVAGGYDGSLGDWRLGAMLHVGRTSAKIDDRNTSGDSTDYGAGLYGGRQWGATRLAFGAAYTRHDWDASRSVGVPGFSDSLSADYSTGTSQAFGKLSHAFDLGVVSLVPYAGLAYVYQSADAFSETGGPAALESQSDAIDATFTTLGLGSRREFLLGDRLMTAKAAVGWRHAYSDTGGAARTIVGGDSFFIVGASVPDDMAVLNAGLNLNVSPDTTLGLTYDGQIGSDGAQSHALKGAWATQF